jgi:hypothetical protein
MRAVRPAYIFVLVNSNIFYIDNSFFEGRYYLIILICFLLKSLKPERGEN